MAEDDLPDPMEPGGPLPAAPTGVAPELPKGDVRVASWIALVTGALVLLWYLSILILGGVYLAEFASPAQIGVWLLAIVSFACGIIALNARRERELAAAGFIAGVVAFLVSLTIGLPMGLQVLF